MLLPVILGFLAAYAGLCLWSWFKRAQFAPVTLRVVEKRGWFWGTLGALYWVVTLGGHFDLFNTTIGNVCAIPRGSQLDDDERIHEADHANVCAALGWGNVWLGLPAFAALYLFLPLPIGFAWFRWRIERRAYLAQLGGRVTPFTADQLAGLIGGRGYFWAWPKAWIRRSLLGGK